MDLLKHPFCCAFPGVQTAAPAPISPKLRWSVKPLDAITSCSGGDQRGQRLNTLYRENITETEILAALEPLLGRYQQKRLPSEGFGDFLHRTGIIALPPYPTPPTRDFLNAASMTVLPALPPLDDLETLSVHLETLSAENRVCWALEHGPDHPALSSSFGAQSAVMLHLLTRFAPDITVILVDTGYLFPETYRFADTLTERLKLNLKVYQPLRSGAPDGSPSWSTMGTRDRRN